MLPMGHLEAIFVNNIKKAYLPSDQLSAPTSVVLGFHLVL